MWCVPQPVLLSLGRCNGDVFSQCPEERQAKIETKPRRVSGANLGGTALTPSKANMRLHLHSHTHTEHQQLMSVLGKVLCTGKAAGKMEQDSVL